LDEEQPIKVVTRIKANGIIRVFGVIMLLRQKNESHLIIWDVNKVCTNP
jgi:hypothetical protein